ncbi:glutathione S-transferase family protein, partial [Xanthomonas nasturtii]
MTTTLYHTPSTAALVVHWLLIELDVPHVLHPLDFERGEQKQPDYLALNPAGVVPTLVLDGQVLTEAAAIVLQLADLHPQAGLAPALGTPERATYYVAPEKPPSSTKGQRRPVHQAQGCPC